MTRPTSRRPNEAGPHRPQPAEPIPPGELWPLSFLHSRLGYGSRSRAQMIRLGLPVFRWGGRSWFSTSDLIRFLVEHGAPQTAEVGENE
jgi:hypothetical protein